MNGREPLVVVDITVPESELVRRLSARRVCEDCGTNADAGRATPSAAARCGGRLKQRSDDREEVVRERLKVYRRDTEPLVRFYEGRPTFRVRERRAAARFRRARSRSGDWPVPVDSGAAL